MATGDFILLPIIIVSAIGTGLLWIWIVGLCFGKNLFPFMTKGLVENTNILKFNYQRLTNDKKRKCDNPDCHKSIKVGESIIKRIRWMGKPNYYHEQCVKKGVS